MKMVEVPKYHLELDFEKHGSYRVRDKQSYLEKTECIGKDFFISTNHFESGHGWIDKDNTWGISGNILFSVNGYCDYWKGAATKTLSLRIEDML